MHESMTTAPAMDLAPQAIDTLVEERRASHAIYRPVCRRREQREGAAQSLPGVLRAIPRKAMAPMPQVQVLLVSILPRRACDAQAVLAIVAYWQQRNHAAYVSPRRCRVAWLHELDEGPL